MTRKSSAGKQQLVSGPERARVAAGLRAKYAAGASVRSLVTETGRSRTWVESLLREAGAREQAPERARVAAGLRAKYAAGASVRSLVTETGRSKSWVESLLREAGAKFRSRGGFA
jgi:hypothetical protein